MFDIRSRTRAGVAPKRPAPQTAGGTAVRDPRVHVDLAQLQSLEPHGRLLSLLPRQSSRSVLSGRHASRLRGRGLNFEELREYWPTDDIRTIDWNVTARTGEPHVRVYTEERDRPALIVVDQRMSMFFGTRHAMKSVTAAEAAALVAFAILAEDDRVGGIVVTDDGIYTHKPKRNRRALTALLTDIAGANQALHADAPAHNPTSLDRVLQAVANIARRDHLILMISDFDVTSPRTERLVGGLARHNDVIFMPVSDPVGSGQVPRGFKSAISDGDLQATLDTGNERVFEALKTFSQRRMELIERWQRRYGLIAMPLSAGEETLPQLRRLLGLGSTEPRGTRAGT